MIPEKSIVVVYLVNPREKYWGRLESLSAVGVYLRGMDLAMTEDWAREIARGDAASMGPSSVFFPLSRLERILIDEDVGAALAVVTLLGRILGGDAVRYL